MNMDFNDRLDEICATANKVSFAMLVISSAAKHAYTASHALARTENASNALKIFAKVEYVADRINDICEIAQRLAQTGEDLRKLIEEKNND